METENKDEMDIDSILSNIALSDNTILENTEVVVEKQDYLTMLKDIQLNVSVVLGTTEIPLEKVLSLKQNSVLELDRNADEDVDIYINDRLIAKAQVVSIDGEYAVQVTEIIDRPNQDGSLETVDQD